MSNSSYHGIDIPVHDIEVARGSAIQPLEMTCKDDAGNPVDLTGWTARAQVRKSYGSALLIDMNPVISDPVNGKVFLDVSGAETSTVPQGSYKWDLVLVDNLGEIRGVFIRGKFIVFDKITQ